jgi:hypothetical protein
MLAHDFFMGNSLVMPFVPSNQVLFYIQIKVKRRGDDKKYVAKVFSLQLCCFLEILSKPLLTLSGLPEHGDMPKVLNFL